MIRREVFDEGFVPGDVVHRNTEIASIESALSGLIDGLPTTDVIAIGPTGVGKTVSTRYALHQLTQEIDVNWTLIDCWEHSSRVDFFNELYEGVGLPPAIDPHQSTDYLLRQFRSRVTEQVILVLDEADRLNQPDILHGLNKAANVTLILIMNSEEELFARMTESSDVKSGLHVAYDAYSTTELVDILQERVTHGLEDLHVSQDVLEKIADRAAGDARVAIQTLYWSAKAAENAGESEIPGKVVPRAKATAEERIRQKTREHLDEHDELLLDIIEDYEEITGQDLHAEYERRASDPVGRRRRRTLLSKLEEYNMIRASGPTSNRVYERIVPPETPDLPL